MIPTFAEDENIQFYINVMQMVDTSVTTQSYTLTPYNTPLGGPGDCSPLAYKAVMWELAKVWDHALDHRGIGL